MNWALLLGMTLILLTGLTLVSLAQDAGKWRRVEGATQVQVLVCQSTEQKQVSGIAFLADEQMKFLGDDTVYDGAVCLVRFGD